MSAIFGIINKNGKPIEEGSIHAIQQALEHRAVDGNGAWHSENILLGNCKLIISPEQQNENALSEDGDLVITADATVHNREDLFARLSIDREMWSIYSDTRLILSSYKKWGDNCLEYFQGEFVFAIWDKQAGKLFCAADHIGFRPLYYYDSPEMFVFASEMKAILAVKKTPNIFNDEFLIEYFFRQSDLTKTYNDEIFALCGGNKLAVQNDGVKIEKYWMAQKTGKYNFKKDNDWAECLRDLLFTAVENRIRTNLPVGVGLSGGLDSSTLACIAGKILEKRNKPLYAFSSVLPEDHKGIELDERKYISIVGNHVKNLEQTYVEAPGVGPFSDLEKVFEIEETLPNTFFYMDHAISAAAEKKNIRVFLTGLGGDFLVSWKGNSVIYNLIQQFHFTDAIKLFLQTKNREKKSYTDLLKTEIVAHTKLYAKIEPIIHKNRINWKYQTTLNENFVNHFRSKLDLRNNPDQVSLMIDFMNSGRLSRLIGTYLNRDRFYKVESAMPMLDKNVMEFMLDVPPLQFRVDGKRRSLLRRAMEGILPPEIQWRNDKLPYSPDYISRTISDKEFVTGVLNSKEYDPAWRYIDRNMIKNNIDKIQPIAGMGFISDISGIRIVQGVISCIFIKWLMSNNYSLKN